MKMKMKGKNQEKQANENNGGNARILSPVPAWCTHNKRMRRRMEAGRAVNKQAQHLYHSITARISALLLLKLTAAVDTDRRRNGRYHCTETYIRIVLSSYLYFTGPYISVQEVRCVYTTSTWWRSVEVSIAVSMLRMHVSCILDIPTTKATTLFTTSYLPGAWYMLYLERTKHPPYEYEVLYTFLLLKNIWGNFLWKNEEEKTEENALFVAFAPSKVRGIGMSYTKGEVCIQFSRRPVTGIISS